MKIDKLDVYYRNIRVGTLAVTSRKKAAFEYDDNWLKKGFSISPFSLPLRKQVFVPEKTYFDGLFGVFADSLPDDTESLKEMYRRMCFNVFAHNRDDHSKNFSFLYHDETGSWALAPAYDLTYSNTYYGEHTTSVDGNGKNPGMPELTCVGTSAGLPKSWCIKTASAIQEKTESMLSEFLSGQI